MAGPVCVTGMHRSGTSMAMSLLAGLGLDIGPEKDLIPASASNPDGHWENVHFVDLDDALLAALGGGWDCPPPSDWSGADAKQVEHLRHRASDLPDALGLREPWGWKDPRVSLLLPFWYGEHPDLTLVVCLRSPRDVALSLKRRGYSSLAFGYGLWRAYNERIVESSRADQRVVTHYDRYFEQPAAELRRLCAHAGLTCDDQSLESTCRRINPSNRHHSSGAADLASSGAPRPVIELYEALCAEAGWTERAKTAAHAECKGD